MKKLLFLFLFSSISVYSKVSLPHIFGSGMVLQQQSKVKIWGWAKSEEPIKINTSWDNETYATKTPASGHWFVEVLTPIYGGPYQISIQGYNNILLENILIGEVWLVSGQSNMEWSARSKIDNAEEEIKNANFANIRLFSVSHSSAPFPQQNISDGKWEVCTSETMSNFSAIGYFFGREIHQKLEVPVGIINSSWGGTPAEAWTPENAIKSNPILYKDALDLKEVIWGPVKTAVIYNAMIAPLAGFKLKGFLWYQGESNVMHASNYDLLLKTMIDSWRKVWNQDLPFYYVQIAPYKYDSPEEGVILRNAQRMVDNPPLTQMVCISDIGNINDIHPGNKLEVGRRLANLALKENYDTQIGTVFGPKLLTYEIKKGFINLYFDTADLVCGTDCQNNFEIAGTDGQFRKANVVVKSNTIKVISQKISNPAFVRFEWNNTTEASLKNSKGLPSSAFITDNWWSFVNK